MNEVLVSVDSSELQRTTLERKKSDELHTIAAALGVKPGSRAKKAEVVDLILSATRGGTISDAPTEPSAGRSSAGATRSGRSASAGAGKSASGDDAVSATAGSGGESPAAKEQSADATSRPTVNSDSRSGAGSATAESRSSQGSGATPTDEVDAAVRSATRRRTPRSVGWAGDETGQPTPTDVVERASLFDTPSAAEARSRAASAANGDTSSGEAAEPSAESTDSKSDGQQDNKSDGGDRGRNNRNNRNNRNDRNDRGTSSESSQRSEGDDSGSAKPSGDESKGDGSNQSSDSNTSNNNRNEGEGTGRRRRRRGRDRDRGENTNTNSNSRNDNSRNDNNRNRNDRDDGRDRTEESSSAEPVPISGHLDLRDEGYGFLRINGFQPARDDAYVSVRQVRQFGLRKGDFLTGTSRPAGYKEKNPALLRIDTVNGVDPEEAKKRPRFEDLTPLFPDQKLTMEIPGDPTNMTARIIDLMSPIGKGQRGLIVSPPKAGKTTIMKHIARSIEVNNPEVHLIVLLVDERPEEVTDMKRWLTRGEVAASTFDRPAEEHIHVAELTIERAKRLVETGKDVCIILDGITRLARAYNLGAPASGRIMSGGIDTGALYPPKKFFGAARNIEEGGSLTVLATALVDTGSRMDEVIFEEFKGTGNMELRLDRRLAERRIYPAIDVDASSTRHEELLFERKQLQQVWKLRRVLSGLRGESGDGGAAAGLELLIDRLKTFKNNDEFLAEVAKGPTID